MSVEAEGNRDSTSEEDVMGWYSIAYEVFICPERTYNFMKVEEAN